MKDFLTNLSNILNGKFDPKIPNLSKRSLKPNDKYKKAIKSIQRSIKTTGYRSIEVRRLLQLFGYKKRGAANLDRINQIFSENLLYCYPVLSMDLNFNDRVKIYNFPVECRGDIFKSEKVLQKFISETNALKQLGVDAILPEYSPNNTSHRMDFYAQDDTHNVVIEVKNEGGQERGVEQVLRYASMIRREQPEKPVRKILITGQLDPNTAKAIHGMTNEERENFEWYLYNYDQKLKLISFEKVDYNHVFSFFKNTVQA